MSFGTWVVLAAAIFLSVHGLVPHALFGAHAKKQCAFRSSPESTNGVAASIWEQLRSALRGTNVYFIGMMGSGKTTVGKEFSSKLGYRFLDTDEIAEFMIEPATIAEYFAAGNETQFRDLEYQILMEMAQYTRLVLSTGGGIVERNDNWGLLHHGIVVFLDLPPEDVYARLSANPEQITKRPLLSGPSPLAKLKELSERRMDKYTQADVRVRVSPTANNEEVAQMACQAILSHIADNPPKWLEWKKKREAAMTINQGGNKGSIPSGEENVLQ